MLNKKAINEEITQMGALKNLTEVYGEIASIRMKKVREFVLENRDFLHAIHAIFQDALNSYARKVAQLSKQGKIKKGERVTLLSHNGKTVAVLISANTGFYGDVVQNTFRKFLEDVRGDGVEVTIIGKIGLALFAEYEPKKPYTFFSLPDYGIDESRLGEVIKHLVQYEEIRVYHGRYVSVINQKPEVLRISAGITAGEGVGNSKIEYLFEPSVEEILKFFETEIFASLFDQSIRESQLAKFASRIMAMDAASENIRKNIKRLGVNKLRIEHRIKNREQINTLVPAFMEG